MAAALIPTTVDRGRRSPQRRRSPRTPDARHAHRLCAGSPGTGSVPIMAHQIDRSACLSRQTPGALRPTITAGRRAIIYRASPWLAGPGYGPTRERLSVCLFIGTGGMHVRICRWSCTLLRSPGCCSRSRGLPSSRCGAGVWLGRLVVSGGSAAAKEPGQAGSIRAAALAIWCACRRAVGSVRGGP
jgi:hypothetical protein